jgi:primosomal protein N'
MVYKMALQQYPTSDIKNYFTYQNQISISQKSLMKKFSLSSKSWKDLIASKTISQTSKSFLFEKITKPIVLNDVQSKIFHSIWKKENMSFGTHLIDGVTGSGKTELYFKLIEENLSVGKQTLVLLPSRRNGLRDFLNTLDVNLLFGTPSKQNNKKVEYCVLFYQGNLVLLLVLDQLSYYLFKI